MTRSKQKLAAAKARRRAAKARAAGGEGERLPRDVRIRLKSVRDLRAELGRVYCQTRSNRLAGSQATKLAYLLQTMLRMVEVESLESRLQKLEERANSGS